MSSAQIATYNQLIENAADFMNVSSEDANIPIFVRLAESQFERVLRVREMQKRVKYRIGETDALLPTDFLQLESLRLSDEGKRLDSVSIDNLEDRGDRTATPQMFSIWGEELVFWPMPDTAVPASMRYVARIPALSPSNPVNPVLTNYPDIYLYGTLMNAEGYLKDDAMASTYGAMFQQAVSDANDMQKRMIRQTIKMRPSGAPV